MKLTTNKWTTAAAIVAAGLCGTANAGAMSWTDTVALSPAPLLTAFTSTSFLSYTHYLEDFTVGMRFVSHTHTMTEAQIIAFAREFDPQPFHTDPVAAETSLFRGLAASGWHTAAVSMRLFVDLQISAADGMIGAGVEQLR